MNRQELFEKAYAEARDMPLDTFAKYRMGDTYRLPGIAKCWRFWNLAIKSVVIDLDDAVVTLHDGGAYLDICIAQEIIETHGVKCK